MPLRQVAVHVVRSTDGTPGGLISVLSFFPGALGKFNSSATAQAVPANAKAITSLSIVPPKACRNDEVNCRQQQKDNEDGKKIDQGHVASPTLPLEIRTIGNSN
jgi:hypothetical protein